MEKINKGISFFFGYEMTPEENAKQIKEAGFDCVITNADKRFDYQNGSIKKQVKLFHKFGLKLSSLHFQYKAEDLPNFFLDNKIGKILEKNLIKDIKIAKRYGFLCVVVHLYGKLSSVGIDRLKRVLKVAEKCNVPIAVENINENEILPWVFENIKSPYLRFCLDAGHQHCFYPDVDYLTLYGDRLICLHLHDNMGDKDAHTLNRFGNIDWEELAKKLARCPKVNLDYELLMKEKCNLSRGEVLKECFNQAAELEKMINKYKKAD